MNTIDPTGSYEATATVPEPRTLTLPTLILQGTRDPFGKPEEVAGYDLSAQINVVWLEDGDHSFKPRKSSGRTLEENVREAIDEIIDFAGGLG